MITRRFIPARYDRFKRGISPLACLLVSAGVVSCVAPKTIIPVPDESPGPVEASPLPASPTSPPRSLTTAAPLETTNTPVVEATAEAATQIPLVISPDFVGPIYAILPRDENHDNSMILFDSSSDTVDYPTFDFGRPIDAWWSDDGCDLVVLLYSSTPYLRFVRVDRHGNVLGTIFEAPLRGIDSELSPNRQWVAYLEVSGGQYYATWEIQDLILINIASTSQRTLSESGGAYFYSWSPGTDYLAYYDSDESDNLQLYLSDVQGMRRTRLTNFSQLPRDVVVISPRRYIGTPIWSSDDSHIAVLITPVQEGDVHRRIVVTGVGDDVAKEFSADDATSLIGWDAAGSSVIYYAEGGRGTGDEALYWLDVSTGETVHELHASQLPVGFFEGVFPAKDGSSITFFASGKDEVYLYDPFARILHPMDAKLFYEGNPYTVVRPSPSGPGGDSSCH